VLLRHAKARERHGLPAHCEPALAHTDVLLRTDRVDAHDETADVN
jgi:hypothetical protein